MARVTSYIVVVVVVVLIVVPGCPAKECNLTQLKADVVFLLDSSTSIKDTDFRKNQEFVKNFVDSVTIDSGHIRVAVVLFAFGATLEFGLDEHLDSASLKLAVNGIKRTWGSTATHAGMKLVRQIFINDSLSHRTDAKRAVVLITDGKSTNGGALQKEASTLRLAGVEIVAVGVTDEINITELQEVTSSKRRVFHVDQYDTLLNVLSEVLQVVCGGVPASQETIQQTSIGTLMFEIGVITACGLVIIGGSICLCKACYGGLCRRSDEEEDKKKLQYFREKSSSSRVSPLPEPEVSSGKPLPMTENNAFSFL